VLEIEINRGGMFYNDLLTRASDYQDELATLRIKSTKDDDMLKNQGEKIELIEKENGEMSTELTEVKKQHGTLTEKLFETEVLLQETKEKSNEMAEILEENTMKIQDFSETIERLTEDLDDYEHTKEKLRFTEQQLFSMGGITKEYSQKGLQTDRREFIQEQQIQTDSVNWEQKRKSVAKMEEYTQTLRTSGTYTPVNYDEPERSKSPYKSIEGRKSSAQKVNAPSLLANKSGNLAQSRLSGTSSKNMLNKSGLNSNQVVSTTYDHIVGNPSKRQSVTQLQDPNRKESMNRLQEVLSTSPLNSDSKLEFPQSPNIQNSHESPMYNNSEKSPNHMLSSLSSKKSYEPKEDLASIERLKSMYTPKGQQNIESIDNDALPHEKSRENLKSEERKSIMGETKMKIEISNKNPQVNAHSHHSSGGAPSHKVTGKSSIRNLIKAASSRRDNI